MKLGDLVRMKNEPYPRLPCGLGFVTEESRGYEEVILVFFPDIAGPGLIGHKWCAINELILVSKLKGENNG